MLLAHVVYLLCLTATHTLGSRLFPHFQGVRLLVPLYIDLLSPGLKYSVRFSLNFSSLLRQSLKILQFYDPLQ